MPLTYLISLIVLIVGLLIYLFTGRNYFNKHKFVRLVKYKDDMSVQVKYIKREQFNKTNEILINPKHVFNLKGYTTVVITDKSSESINPNDFESKYSAKDFKSGMRSKLVKDAFDSVKVEKFDKMTFLLILSALQFLAIIYLLYSLLGGVS